MTFRTRTSAAIALTIALALEGASTAFAAGTMTLQMVPHCTEASGCPEFTVVDGSHYTTGQLSAGDILDIDVLVRGAEHRSVRSVRSWISYDPKALEARSVEITSAVPSPTPGEQTIDASQGLIKIGGSATDGFPASDTRIARVTFRVLNTTANTELSFQGYNDAGNGQTFVNGDRGGSNADEKGSLPAPPCIDAILGCGGIPTPLLSGKPSILTVKLTAEAQGNILAAEAAQLTSSSSSAPTASTALSSSASSVSSAPGLIKASGGLTSSAQFLTGAGSTFAILQVQDVRVTTKDDVIFLGWQALRSSELAGYNVYYGTVSGRYLQRRSLPATSTSLVLRELQPGTTYYLAVRALNGQDQESVFSQEVSVTVGKPETATSPMTKLPTEVKGNPIEKRGGTTINGETGTSDMIVWIVVGSAVVGTGFAFRRQLVL